MSGPNTSSAVMQQRREPHKSLDDFPTPPWATRALCEWLQNDWDGLSWPENPKLAPSTGRLVCREPAANRGHIKTIVSNANTTLTTAVDQNRDLAEFLDLTPLVLENVYNAVDRENGSLRIRLMTDRVLFETSLNKEMCNILRLRQLGCSTGTIQDYGPDFGLTYIMDGLATMGQK